MNYYANTNRLKSVADGMGGTGDNRNMGDVANFVYDSEGNLTEDKSKQMKIAYDWRGMPVEFVRRAGNGDSLKLAMLYDGGGRRFSKTRLRKGTGAADWSVEHVTHYTGIGTEVREYMPWNFVRFTDSQGVEHCISANPDYAGTASTTCPLPDTVRVVVPLPNGLGRHALQDAAYEEPLLQGAYEFYLKDHLGSTRVVYGVGFPDPLGISPNGVFRAAYDYRSFGEQLDLFVFSRKVTENFTGKELDDETELNYFGARYLDPMLGLWVSVDPARQFASPYLYAGNGVNPIGAVDPDGAATISVGAYGSASIGLLGVSGGASVNFNTNPKSLGDFIYISASAKTGVGYSIGTSGKIRVGYSSGDPESGLSASIVESGIMPIAPGVVVGGNKATDTRTDNVTTSVEIGLGAEVGGELQAETSYSTSISDLFNRIGKFFDERMKEAVNTDYSDGGTD